MEDKNKNNNQKNNQPKPTEVPKVDVPCGSLKNNDTLRSTLKSTPDHQLEVLRTINEVAADIKLIKQTLSTLERAAHKGEQDHGNLKRLIQEELVLIKSYTKPWFK